MEELVKIIWVLMIVSVKLVGQANTVKIVNIVNLIHVKTEELVSQLKEVTNVCVIDTKEKIVINQTLAIQTHVRTMDNAVTSMGHPRVLVNHVSLEINAKLITVQTVTRTQIVSTAIVNVALDSKGMANNDVIKLKSVHKIHV